MMQMVLVRVQVSNGGGTVVELMMVMMTIMVATEASTS